MELETIYEYLANQIILSLFMDKNTPKVSTEKKAAEKVWKKVTRAEQQLALLKTLQKKGLCLNQVHQVLRSLRIQLKESTSDTRPARVVQESVMNLKVYDAKKSLRKVIKERDKLRNDLRKKLGDKSRRYKNIIKYAKTKSKELGEKIKKKHLKKMLHIEEKQSEEVDIPEELSAYNLKIFKMLLNRSWMISVLKLRKMVWKKRSLKFKRKKI